MDRDRNSWYYKNMSLQQLKSDMNNKDLLGYYREACKHWYYKKLEDEYIGGSK